MILRGDSLSVLKTLPDESVQCIMTSPPYWALRKYDIPDIVFDGDADCEHEWGAPITRSVTPQTNLAALADVHAPRLNPRNAIGQDYAYTSSSSFCQCGAWRGQLGQEPTPELFIRHLVEIFREARRVLRPDGTCWLNMGDCYAADRSGTHMPAETIAGGVGGLGQDLGPYRGRGVDGVSRRDCTRYGLKHKDLVGIPWMLAFALRADGWYLRAEIIWAKGLSFCPSYAGSVMPESVTDRPTRSHEQVFLLTKAERYYYDHEAVKEQGVYPAGTRAAKGSGTREGNRRGSPKQDGTGNRRTAGFNERYFAPDEDGYATYDGTRNLRTVWAIGVEPFSEAHFATYPPDLVYPCLRAGTSAKGACAACGAPWKRIVEYEPLPDDIKAQFEAARSQTAEDHGRDDGFTTRRPNYVRKRTGERWEPTCACGVTETVPCTVLDPFAGSGTTGVVAELLRLEFIGIDLGYHEMSEQRIGDIAPLFRPPVAEQIKIL